MEQKPLVMALLRDHITITRLNTGLTFTGLDADDFTPDLGNTIFQLMGLGEDGVSDERFSVFLERVGKIAQFDVSEWKQKIDPLADELFILLEGWQKAA